MKIVFCKKCGGRNNVSSERINNSGEKPLSCSICGNVMPPDALLSPGGGAVAEAVLDTSRYHLLFVDDDKAYLNLAESILGKDYKVSVASSGAEGLLLASQLQPDIVLLDVKMPGEDGYAICRKIKQNPATCHMAVFFVTATFESEDVHRGFMLGAVDYIHKPLQLDELNARITLQLRLKQLEAK
ncbi:MAG: hypothetical protein DSY50_02980 [Desulfobulbus sp.]|nr:MAG: hypothetical protein DSY50_02980 [Desulfobulbus sp.]RUM38806.1 MAG: hypothetical protein DSY70_07130 [Desulfobulbus sp.]